MARGNFTNHPPNAGRFQKGVDPVNKGRRTSLGIDDSERFWKFVTKAEGCWPWTGATDAKGYGRFHAHGMAKVSHRVAYHLAVAPVPKGANVLHRCDNRPCCNPAHLFLGSLADNNKDMHDKGRASIGEHHPGAKLTPAKVAAMKRLRASGWTYQRIADRYGVHNVTAFYAITGKTWKKEAR